MAKIGYARVSTKDQNEARQLAAFKEQGVEKHFIDKCSGATADRPELLKMLDYVREGDVVVVTEYARLARSVKDLLNIIDQLSEKGVQLVSLKENIDTTSPQGKFMMTVFAGLAEFERDMIRQRQLEGIAIAHEQGKYKGRQPIPIDLERFKAECRKWRAGEQTARQTMAAVGMKPNRFYRNVKKFDL